MPPDNRYSIVLPLKLSSHYHHNELTRFICILLPSLNKYLDIASVHEFIIICKPEEIKLVKNELGKQQSSLPINIISENLILKGKVISKTKGWYIQQLLKLGIARRIKTNYYLVLDSDCFLTKPFDYEKLFHHEKLIMNSNSWKVHKNWWLNSANIMGIPFDILKEKPVIGVTPEILITSSVCDLLDFLTYKNEHLDWDEYLCTQKFTEFTLYWLFLIKSGLTNRYQKSGEPILLGNGLWRSTYTYNFSLMFHLSPNNLIKQSKREQFIEKHISKTFENNNSYYFSLIQSNIKHLSVECIANHINKHLDEQ